MEISDFKQYVGESLPVIIQAGWAGKPVMSYLKVEHVGRKYVTFEGYNEVYLKADYGDNVFQKKDWKSTTIHVFTSDHEKDKHVAEVVLNRMVEESLREYALGRKKLDAYQVYKLAEIFEIAIPEILSGGI